ncbi:MAG: PAS domain S-box protein, partial [Vicinamibacterales bacterium]|nr:PAS domain S-box protein [Vicinamibacterales bacterium]
MDNRTRILAAIRNLNQLVVREENSHRLLDEASRLLALWAIDTETRRQTLDRQHAAVPAATIDAVLAVDPDGRITVFNPGAEELFGCTAAEEALRRSEWYLRSTVDALSAPIVVLDDRGEIILTNKAYRDFGERNGVEPDVASEGANYLTVCDAASGEHSEEAKPFAEGIREVLSGKRSSFELEYPCHSPHEKRWFIGRVTPFTGEGPRRVVVVHENITGRKEAEMQLRLQSLVLNQIQDCVTVTDLDGVITYVNEAEVRALGYPRGELIGVSTEKYGEDAERGATQREIVEETLEHGTWRGEVVNQTADGQEVILDCRTQVVFDEHGRRIALAGISTDITGRKRAEQALRESE